MSEKQPASPAPQPGAQLSNRPAENSAQLPDEYDRRGIKLPARTLVGGIITPV